jgi:hypothetical protein
VASAAAEKFRPHSLPVACTWLGDSFPCWPIGPGAPMSDLAAQSPRPTRSGEPDRPAPKDNMCDAIWFALSAPVPLVLPFPVRTSGAWLLMRAGPDHCRGTASGGGLLLVRACVRRDWRGATCGVCGACCIGLRADLPGGLLDHQSRTKSRNQTDVVYCGSGERATCRRRLRGCPNTHASRVSSSGGLTLTIVNGIRGPLRTPWVKHRPVP